MLGFCQFLLVAGSATTTLLIGNVVHRLLEHPDQLAMVRADRSLIPAAVEESLRFDAPVHGLFRTPTCPVDAARRDRARGRQGPGALRLGQPRPGGVARSGSVRHPRDLATLKRNYAFGHGIHYCLGAPLARLEARRRRSTPSSTGCPTCVATASPTGVAAAVLHGFERYPIAWT